MGVATYVGRRHPLAAHSAIGRLDPKQLQLQLQLQVKLKLQQSPVHCQLVTSPFPTLSTSFASLKP